MAWIEARRRRDGSTSFWIRDRRGDHQIVIHGGDTREEAEQALDRYKVRRDLEKEGYEDKYQALADSVFGKRLKGTRHGMG